MALKAFFVYLILAAISHSLGDSRTRMAGIAVACGISATYIIVKLRKWAREKETVKGAGIAWTAAALFLLAGLGGVAGTGAGGGSQTAAVPQTDSARPVRQQEATPSPGYCGTGQTCRVLDSGSGDSVFVFRSKQALDEGSASSSAEELTSLVFARQLYMVPSGTKITVLDWSGWSGWHKVRILSPGAHTGDVGYILDKWSTFEQKRLPIR